MSMTMKEHMAMMDRIRRGENAKATKVKTTRVINDDTTNSK